MFFTLHGMAWKNIIDDYDLFQLYGECFDKEMFEYVLNLVYNLPKSEASVVYGEMTDKLNEIRLGKAEFFTFAICISFKLLWHVS